jgi:hypothetical protein
LKTSIVIAVIGVVALLLGLFLALPLFTANLNHPALKYPGGRAYIGLDVVYAYFKLEPFNQNIPGLWRNTSDPAQVSESLTSYVIIMNVTNYSNSTVYMESFEATAAKYMSSVSNKSYISQEIREPFLTSTLLTNGVNDRINQVFPTATIWEPYESRLVAFSGVEEVTNTSLLQTGTFYMGGHVDGTPIDGLSSQGVGSKLVRMSALGNEFLYNILVGPNQVLRFTWDGQIAYVDEAQ